MSKKILLNGVDGNFGSRCAAVLLEKWPHEDLIFAAPPPKAWRSTPRWVLRPALPTSTIPMVCRKPISVKEIFENMEEHLIGSMTSTED